MKDTFNYKPSGNEEEKPEIANYETAGQVRSITFVQPDGKARCMFYHDLRAIDYTPDEPSIVLQFPPETITLKGNNLSLLFADLRNQLPKEITAIDKRYIDTKEQDDVYVTEINIG